MASADATSDGFACGDAAGVCGAGATVGDAVGRGICCAWAFVACGAMLNNIAASIMQTKDKEFDFFISFTDLSSASV